MRENPLILLAEDNFASQHAAESMLHRLGYRVDISDTGIAAVEACLSSPYDAVLYGRVHAGDGRLRGRTEIAAGSADVTLILALTAGEWIRIVSGVSMPVWITVYPNRSRSVTESGAKAFP
jgi:DNA-binding response OmpR family regulator